MTDIPRVGLLCTGNSTASLATAVFSAKAILKLLKEGGYAIGGYYTLLIEPDNKERAAEKLRQLCLYNNLAVTLGCDGFSPADVMPEVTKSICDRDAPFFALHLCGAANIHNYGHHAEVKREGNSDLGRLLPERPARSSYPSRSTAGICGSCLVLNLPKEEETAKLRLSSIMPMLNFALVGLCGRSAATSVAVERNLVSSQSELLRQQKFPRINTHAI